MLSSPRVSSQAEIRQEFRMRVERRDALLLPGAASSSGERIDEYQASRCMSSPPPRRAGSDAIGATDNECRELA